MSDWPDPEYAVRNYLRQQGIPYVHVAAPTGVKLPYITISRVGGGDDSGLAPIDNALLQLDVYGSTKAEAHTIVANVRTVFSNIVSAIHVEPDTMIHGINIAGVVWSPDPDDDTSRYVITAQAVCTIP
jgi:hypothetical protein